MSANKLLIVITGASSGIGTAIAQVFSQAGYPLALLSRNLEAMKKLNLKNTLIQSIDVTDKAVLSNAIHIAEEKFGPVDCLINNAGVSKNGDFTEVPHTDHENMVNINLQGVINGIEVVLSGMRERKKGTIINMSSLSDRTSRPNNSVYAATKAAVKSLTESLRMANAKFGIRFCNLAPAKIHTPMWNQEYDPDHFISPTELAEIVLWIYQQPQIICIRDMVITPTNYEP